MNKTVFTILFFVCAVATPIFAKQYPDRGLYGSLGVGYKEDKYKSSRSENIQKDFLQEYKLGYAGNIYSPRLVDYKAEGLLRYEEIKAQSGATTGSTKIDSKDYNFDADFIKETKYPFRIFTRKSNRPTNTIYADTSNDFKQELNSYGLSGLMRFGELTYDYGATKSRDLRVSVVDTRDIERDQYRSSVRYDAKTYNYQLSYNRLEQTTVDSNAEGNLTRKDIDDTVNFNSMVELSKALIFNSNIRYAQSDYYKNKTTTADVNLRWTPNMKYNGSIFVIASRVDIFLPADENLTAGETRFNRTDTLNINQNFNYNMTPALTFSQNLTYFGYKAPTATGKNIRLRLGTNYYKQLNPYRVINLAATLDTRAAEDQVKNSQTGIVEYRKKNTYILDSRASVTEEFPSIFSRLQLRSTYYGSRSSLSDKNDRYGAGAALSTRYGQIENSINANYLAQKSVIYFASTSSSSSRSSTQTDISENMSYTARINLRGKWRARAGIRYENIVNNGQTIKRTLPQANLYLNYRFFRRVRFSTSAHIDKDLSYNYLNYSSISDIKYSVRLTTLSLGYKYYKTTGNGGLNITRTNVEVKLTRKF